MKTIIKYTKDTSLGEVRIVRKLERDATNGYGYLTSIIISTEHPFLSVSEFIDYIEMIDKYNNEDGMIEITKEEWEEYLHKFSELLKDL